MIHASGRAAGVKAKARISGRFMQSGMNTSSYVAISLLECDIVRGMRGECAIDFIHTSFQKHTKTCTS
jgi:hypothetical protein